MKKAVHEGLLFSCCQKAAQKHGWYPSQSVWRASLSAKSQENPALTLLLSSGNTGSCCKGWYPCFCDGLSYFLRICRIRFSFPVPGEREGENQEPVYRDSSFLSVKAAFRPELSRYT